MPFKGLQMDILSSQEKIRMLYFSHLSLRKQSINQKCMVLIINVSNEGGGRNNLSGLVSRQHKAI